MTLLNVAAKLKKNYRKYMLVFIPKNWYFLTHFPMLQIIIQDRTRTHEDRKSKNIRAS